MNSSPWTYFMLDEIEGMKVRNTDIFIHDFLSCPSEGSVLIFTRNSKNVL